MMRAPAQDELLSSDREDMNEILFLVVAFECRVRLPLAPFMRWFLSELSFHLF